MFNWFSKKRKNDDDRDARQFKKINDSQTALLHAATSTADAAQDVTGLLRDRLDDSLRQLDITAKLLNDGLFLCADDGTIESVNPAVTRIFDWAGTDLVGRNITMLFKSVKDHNMTLDEITRVFNSTDPMVNDPYLEEDADDYIRGKKKDGQLFWADGDVKFIERLNGSIKILFLIRDVTAKVDIFKEMEQNEHRYRTMVDQSFDVIMVVQNHYIVSVNQAVTRVFNYDPNSMIAQPLINYVRPDLRCHLTEMHTNRMNGSTDVTRTTVEFIASDGEPISVLWISTPLIWEGSVASLITLRVASEYSNGESHVTHPPLL